MKNLNFEKICRKKFSKFFEMPKIYPPKKKNL